MGPAAAPAPSHCVLSLHGFASSSHGTKATFFRSQFRQVPGVRFEAFDFSPTPADFTHMTITGLVNRVRQWTLDERVSRLRVVASSMGALVGLQFAHQYQCVERMLLLAPALGYWGLGEAENRAWRARGRFPFEHYGFETEVPLEYAFHEDATRYATPVAPPCPLRLIHGVHDAEIPVARSRAYARQYPDAVHLVELPADHTLNEHLPAIWEHVQAFLLP